MLIYSNITAMHCSGVSVRVYYVFIHSAVQCRDITMAVIPSVFLSTKITVSNDDVREPTDLLAWRSSQSVGTTLKTHK